MSMFTKVLYTLSAVAAIVYVASAIFSFFGVGFETYGIYLFFLVAIALFNSFLPDHVGDIFQPKVQPKD